MSNEDALLSVERDAKYPLGRRCNLERLVQIMHDRHIDGLVAYLRPNVFYLSSYAPGAAVTGHEYNPSNVVVISRSQPEHPIMIIPEHDVTALVYAEPWITDVRPFASILLPLDIPVEKKAIDRFIPKAIHDVPWVQQARANYSGTLVEATAKAMTDLGLDRGTVGFDYLPFADQVKEVLAESSFQPVDASGAIVSAREVKTPEEIEILKTASAVNQAAIERTIAAWERGISWQELMHTYDVTAVELGGFVEDPGGTILGNPPGDDDAFWARYGNDDFEIEPGMYIMWDAHGRWQQYCWDGGKTWVVADEPRGEGKKNLKATSRAMERIQEMARPGVKISEMQAGAREVFRKAGVANFDKVLIFFHGLGLDHLDMEHSFPRQDWDLKRGMVLSVHLHVPGDDHARSWLENIFQVTEHGGDPLVGWGTDPYTG